MHNLPARTAGRHRQVIARRRVVSEHCPANRNVHYGAPPTQSAAHSEELSAGKAHCGRATCRNVVRTTPCRRPSDQEILLEARGTKNRLIALQAIGRIERQIELEARFLGELDASARMAMGVQGESAAADVSGLTPEQLFQEQRILREAREKIEAVRTGRPLAVMIEARTGRLRQ
jgi:hypothetical protein